MGKALLRKLAAVGWIAVTLVALGSTLGCGSNNATGGGPDGGRDGTLGDSGVGLPDGGPFNPDSGGKCLNLGGGCTAGSECCSGTCKAGVCAFPSCISDTQACMSGSQCCSGVCTGGTCTALNTTCKTLGNTCTAGSDCCSMFCSGGVCTPASFCGQQGDICGSGSDCCSNVCNVTPGQPYGTCGAAPTGPSNCGMPDGYVCGGVLMGDAGIPQCGGPCCSRLCAPYGPTGVLVCQPASGCHVVGDLCTTDSDCCYDAPGSCTITPPATLGVCRNAMGCQPNGDVCKLQTTSCNSRCDCCAGNCETMDTCRPDNVGVPRCAVAQCVNAGNSCASSADCCNNMPCVPNPNPGDGGSPFVCVAACVPSCGACTINADCCPGESCVVAQGSTMGICGPCSDAGIPPPPADAAPPPNCALYGQDCTTSANCCNGVPCSYGTGPCTGQTGCTCHFPIQ